MEWIGFDARGMERNQKKVIPIYYLGPKRNKRYRLQISDEGLALNLLKEDGEPAEEETNG